MAKLRSFPSPRTLSSATANLSGGPSPGPDRVRRALGLLVAGLLRTVDVREAEQLAA
jgi:hypothetical protein